MTLSATTCALLRACSEAMAQGTETEINLYDLRRDFGTAKDEILAELVRGVEDTSDNLRTLRRCDPALFNSHGGNGLYVVVCEVSTPEGVVTELSDDMALYTVGAYQNGLTTGERASQDEIESYRAFVTESDRRSEQSSRGKQEADEALAELHELIKARMARANNDQQSDAEYALRNADLGFSLKEIAEACVAVNVSLKDLFAEATQNR